MARFPRVGIAGEERVVPTERPLRPPIASPPHHQREQVQHRRQEPVEEPYRWDRSQTLALAPEDCPKCHGAGVKISRWSRIEPCKCVLRQIFRICFRRYQRCVMQDRHISRVRLDPSGGRTQGINSWGRKDEEYIAEVELIAKRELDQAHWRVFRYHFLKGASWRLCCRKLGMERGNFYHAVYRIERKLGRVFIELKPYALFPLDEYFQS